MEVRLIHRLPVPMHGKLLMLAIANSAAVDFILIGVLISVFWDVPIGWKAKVYLYTMMGFLFLFVPFVAVKLLRGETDNNHRSSTCAVVEKVEWKKVTDKDRQIDRWCK